MPFVPALDCRHVSASGPGTCNIGGSSCLWTPGGSGHITYMSLLARPVCGLHWALSLAACAFVCLSSDTASWLGAPALCLRLVF